jgi:hypothetical protein
MTREPTSGHAASFPAGDARVSWGELPNTFEFVSFQSGIGDNQAFICRETGKIYWRSADPPLDEYEELPDDIEDEEKYLPVPDKRELDLGKPLVLDFAREFLPDDLDYIRDMFRRRGAYGQFKALLGRRNAVKLWQDFENKAAERALRDWCKVNCVALAD